MLQALLAPIASDVVTLRIVRDLQGELGFSEDEMATLQFEEDNGQVRWNPDVEAAQTPKEFNFGPAALRIIREQLEKVSARKALTLQQLTLYDRFVGDEENSEDGQ